MILLVKSINGGLRARIFEIADEAKPSVVSRVGIVYDLDAGQLSIRFK
jgi:hypothetical protein